MKALKLRIFDIRADEVLTRLSAIESYFTWKTIPANFADMVVRGKRFTDAELAAEYWQAEVRLADFMAGLKAPYATDDMDKLEAMDHLVDTICCFAALPNYDEVAS